LIINQESLILVSSNKPTNLFFPFLKGPTTVYFSFLNPKDPIILKGEKSEKGKKKVRSGGGGVVKFPSFIFQPTEA